MSSKTNETTPGDIASAGIAPTGATSTGASCGTLASGHLLGGRVIHAQPRSGHRTGLEPVLLAASIGARAGDHVLEAGCGSGAGLLCLATRVPGIRGVGLDIDAALIEIAAANFAANRFETLSTQLADLGTFRGSASFDHAFANPPWHLPAGTPSADPRRERAKRAAANTFELWATRLAPSLRHRGTLTFVVATAALPGCLAAFAAAGCGSTAILPLWPRAGMPAKLMLLRTVRGGRGSASLLPGLVLHSADGSFTQAADAILRDGAPLPFD